MFARATFFIVLLGILSSANAGEVPAGALIEVTYDGVAGVLLDEIIGLDEAFVNRYIAHYASKEASFWERLAWMQGQMMEYRQIFRIFFYEDGTRGSLTTPPEHQWQFTFHGAGPTRRQIDGHEYLAWDYSFFSYLLTDAESPAGSDPALGTIGGKVVETYVMPVDPEYLLARTGYACMDEDGFPLNSVYGDNVWVYYDDTCEVEGICHITQFPTESCVASLQAHVGRMTVDLTWIRVAWNATIADQWRFGENPWTHAEKAPVVHPDSDLQVIWRYFSPTACELQKSEGGCVKAPGWRRLFIFSSSSTNLGREPLHLGNVTDSRYTNGNVFEFSDCHDHFHFRGFADYQFGDEPTTFKVGFCLQDTWRTHNNEQTPLLSSYPTCQIQGGSPGWQDDYIRGLPCNWIDVTEFSADTVSFSQHVNPLGLACEGAPILNGEGEYQFVETDISTADGEKFWKVLCDYNTDYQENNVESRSVTLSPIGSYVTGPCWREQSGPLRDCDFHIVDDLRTCTPGEEVTLSLHTPRSDVPVVVRICESTHQWSQSTACEYEYAIANEILESSGDVTFTCPSARDENEPGGLYSILVAPVLRTDHVQELTVDESSSTSLRSALMTLLQFLFAF